MERYAGKEAEVGKMSVQEYLRTEENPQTKTEYYHGTAYGLAGASYDHSLIASNSGYHLQKQMGKRPCTVHGSDLKIALGQGISFVYPDAMVMCGEPRFWEGRTDIITNPLLVVEVISPSSANWDRGEKFRDYQLCDSLQEYVVIEQNFPHVDVFTRGKGRTWVLESYSDLNDFVQLHSLEILIRVGDIYTGKDFGRERMMVVMEPRRPYGLYAENYVL